MALGALLQIAGCTFDSQAFIDDSLTAIYNNVTTALIVSALTDLLDVAPTFSF